MKHVPTTQLNASWFVALLILFMTRQMLKFITSLQLGVLCCFSTHCFARLTLESAFELSKKNLETYKAEQEKVEVVRQKRRQVISAVMPRLDIRSSYLEQDESNSSKSSGTNGFIQNKFTGRFQLTQPVFQGFQEFYGIQKSKIDVQTQEYDKLEFERSLFINLSQTFFKIISLQKQKEILLKEIEVTEKRMGDLVQREKIGRTRKSEVLSTQAQLLSIRAQYDKLTSDENSEIAALTLIIGGESNSYTEIVDPLDGFDFTRIKIESLETNLKTENRPDLQSKIFQQESQEKLLSMTKSQHFPKIDFTANYHFKRSGSLSGIDWDIQFLAVLPIFYGGQITYDVREKAHQLKIKEYEKAYAFKIAENEVNLSQQNLKAKIKQLSALKLSVKSYLESQAELERDYKAGLVSNLEVLQSLTQMYSAQRSMIVSEYDVKSEYVKLKTATNGIMLEDLHK